MDTRFRRLVTRIVRSEGVDGRPREGCSEIVLLGFLAPRSIGLTCPSPH